MLEEHDKLGDYTVYDQANDRIGKVEDLFLDEDDRPEYIGVKTGFLGVRSTLIPMGIVSVDEASRSMTVSVHKRVVEDAPTFDDDREITPQFERQVRAYYGLEGGQTYPESGAYGAYYPDAEASTDTRGHVRATTDHAESGESRERGTERLRGQRSEEELRIQRSEEELRAGTREREAGAIKVRKRVVTERKRMSVPTRREEVIVERVPVEDRASSNVEIGEEEISVPVVEEEVVVEKRPVVKEEIRIRKDVVEERETVEAQLRKEEIEIDDTTTRRDL